jgi:hypothetical protein
MKCLKYLTLCQILLCVCTTLEAQKILIKPSLILSSNLGKFFVNKNLNPSQKIGFGFSIQSNLLSWQSERFNITQGIVYEQVASNNTKALPTSRFRQINIVLPITVKFDLKSKKKYGLLFCLRPAYNFKSRLITKSNNADVSHDFKDFNWGVGLGMHKPINNRIFFQTLLFNYMASAKNNLKNEFKMLQINLGLGINF